MQPDNPTAAGGVPVEGKSRREPPERRRNDIPRNGYPAGRPPYEARRVRAVGPEPPQSAVILLSRTTFP